MAYLSLLSQRSPFIVVDNLSCSSAQENVKDSERSRLLFIFLQHQMEVAEECRTVLVLRIFKVRGF